MAGMRDRLIHGYDVVRLEVVWSVITLELPTVEKRLRVILRDLGFEPPVQVFEPGLIPPDCARADRGSERGSSSPIWRREQTSCGHTGPLAMCSS